MDIKTGLSWKAIGFIFAGFLAVMATAYGGVEYYTSSSAFCGGSCHTMTEQDVAWKASKHHASKNDKKIQAECVECHFLPGEKRSLKVKYEALRHLFAYLYDANAPLPIRPKIPDDSCLQAGCHSKEKLEDQELKFSKKEVRFKHKVHFSGKALAGQKLNCDTCHFKASAERHFETPSEICFLCHLKLGKPTLDKAEMEQGKIERINFSSRPAVDFNQGASRCGLCHTIPEKSLQKQLNLNEPGARPITHKSLQEAGVPCESCHFGLVKGHGEINTGDAVSNGCLTCHNRSAELLAKARDVKLMHDKHVAPRRADCFDCHSVVEHKNQPDHYNFVRNDCSLCHEDAHKFQLALLTGKTDVAGVAPTPQLMDPVNTNCLACHVKKTLSKGHTLRAGSGEACAGCHTEEHKKMLAEWKEQVKKEVNAAKELETEAAKAMAAAKESNIPEDKLKKAEAMIQKGQHILSIIEYGNGTHNKKLAIMLADQVFGQFEGAKNILKSGNEKK